MSGRGDNYRNVNTFLEVWFQSLDAWMTYVYSLQRHDRNIFREQTIEKMTIFLQNLYLMEFEEDGCETKTD